MQIFIAAITSFRRSVRILVAHVPVVRSLARSLFLSYTQRHFGYTLIPPGKYPITAFTINRLWCGSPSPMVSDGRGDIIFRVKMRANVRTSIKNARERDERFTENYFDRRAEYRIVTTRSFISKRGERERETERLLGTMDRGETKHTMGCITRM